MNRRGLLRVDGVVGVAVGRSWGCRPNEATFQTEAVLGSAERHEPPAAGLCLGHHCRRAGGRVRCGGRPGRLEGGVQLHYHVGLVGRGEGSGRGDGHCGAGGRHLHVAGEVYRSGRVLEPPRTPPSPHVCQPQGSLTITYFSHHSTFRHVRMTDNMRG